MTKDPAKPPTLGDLLEAICSVEPAIASGAVSKLITERKLLFSAAEDARFATAVATLASEARSGSSEVSRWTAIAALERLGSSLGAKRGEDVRQILRDALVSGPSETPQLRDADERAFAVRALSLARDDWAVPLLATVALTDYSATKVVAAAVHVLVEKKRGVDGALAAMNDSHPKDSSGLQQGQASAVIAAICDELDTEDRVTNETAVLLDDFLRRVSRSDKASHDLADNVLRCVRKIVKTRFLLALEPRTYDATRRARSWFDPLDWPRFAKKSDLLRRVRTDLNDALMWLAGQGRFDEELAEAFRRLHETDAAAETAVTAHAEAARRAAGAAAAPRYSSESAALVAAGRTDEELAIVLRLALKVKNAAGRAGDGFLSALGLTNAVARDEGAALVREAHGLAQVTIDMCTRRRLEVLTSVGAVVEYSPSEHDVDISSGTGIRWVRILEPAVVKQQDAGTRVVLRAIAEPTVAPSKRG